jgi:lipopolysaccharide/colanic/teichoic acid biosynthesis glycosyltransferase
LSNDEVHPTVSAHDSLTQDIQLRTFASSPYRRDIAVRQTLDLFLDGACVLAITFIVAVFDFQRPLQWPSFLAMLAGSACVTACVMLLLRHVDLYDLPDSPLSIIETERMLRGVSYLAVLAVFVSTALSVSLLHQTALWSTGILASLSATRFVTRTAKRRTSRANTSTLDNEIGKVSPRIGATHHFAHALKASDKCKVSKRLFDVIVASTLLLALSPILSIVAIAIKLDSRGPIFFRQVRIGKAGRPFRIWKFRSMYPDAAAYERSPTRTDDPRITPVGRLLRRLSIDELPQLINVLAGQMSLVGPRPEMPFIVNAYRGVARCRLLAVPGITGLWQISPARVMPIHENLQYDFFYLQHRNFFLDLAILLRTAAAVLRPGSSC